MVPLIAALCRTRISRPLTAAVDEARVSVEVLSPPTVLPVKVWRYLRATPRVPPLPAADVVAIIPYPSVPATKVEVASKAEFGEGMRYAGELVERPPFTPLPASFIESVQPRPTLQESVVDAVGVEVEIALLVKVPNAVEETSVLQETLDATVALTVTVEEKTRVSSKNQADPATKRSKTAR